MTTLLDGLVAYWKLDETSGTRNDSHRANHLAQTNTPSYSAGKIGNACNLVRTSNQYLSIADNTDLSTGDIDFTFSCWIKLASKPGNYMIPISKRNGGTNWEYQLDWNFSTDRLEFYVLNNSGASTIVIANALGAPSTGTWYHVVTWHDSVNNIIGIRIDDQYENTAATTTTPSNSTAEFRIGTTQDTPASYAFDGDIDEVAMWKRTLTAAEKTALYNGGSGRAYPFNIDIHDMLIDVWRHDESSGNRLALINANTLTDWNGVSSAAGKKGNATVCDAAKALYHADNALLSTGTVPFTFSTWVYLTSKPAQYQGIVGKWHAGGSPNEYLLYYEYVNDRFLWEPGSYSVFANAFGSPALNTWHHLLVWYDPYICEAGIRVNDTSQNLDTGTCKNAPPNSTDEFDVGTFDNRTNANIGLRGRVDEMYFWKRILTPTEKTLMYSVGSAPYTDYPFGAANNRTRRGIARGVGRGT